MYTLLRVACESRSVLASMYEALSWTTVHPRMSRLSLRDPRSVAQPVHETHHITRACVL